jgi:membrane-bound inhibitor of C-type lysozyme
VSASIRYFPCVAGLGLLLSGGCTGVDVQRTLYPAQITYQCGDGKLLSVARSADARSASVLADGKIVTLPRADSAAEEKYSDGTYALYLDKERAMLEENGKVLFGSCQSQTLLPTAPRPPY